MKNNEETKKGTTTYKTDIDQAWSIPKTDVVAPATRYEKRVVDTGKLQSIVNHQAERMNDSEGIMELLPDLTIVESILVSSILSPKDLRDVLLNITVAKNAPPEIADIVKKHFTTIYNLESKLYDILAEALFTKGSFVRLIIPPKSISKIIHQNTYGLENIDDSNKLSRKFNYENIAKLEFQPIGLLEKKINTNTCISLEDIWSDVFTSTAFSGFKEKFNVNSEIKFNKTDKNVIDLNNLLEITDNALYLAMPAVVNSVSKIQTRNILQIAYGLEDIYNGTSEKTEYINRSVKFLPQDIIPEIDLIEESELNPLVLNISQESCIIVHVPGDPKKHVGYYVFIDEQGNPIKYNRKSNKWRELDTKLKNNMAQQAFTNTLQIGLSYVSSGSGNITYDTTKSENDTLLNIYRESFDRKLEEAFNKGGTGKTIEVSDPEELYRVVLARQYEKQRTRVVYVPVELCSYIAFNYADTGIGISLLEKTKLLSSFRAVLMFASIMAGVNSSINRRKMTIKLEEDDANPRETIEEIINEFLSVQTKGSPYGMLNPVDIVDSLQRAGIQFVIEGNDSFPSIDIDIAENKHEVTPPDDALIDKIRDMHYRALWVEPDVAINSTNVDFASVAASNNVLAAKRYNSIQKRYTEQQSIFIRKYILAGGPLFNEIRSKLEECVDKEKPTLYELIDSITLTLPAIDTAVLSSQSKAYDDYCAVVDKVIDSFISEEMLKETLGGENIGTNITTIKLAIGNLLKRDYARSENILPELDNLINSEDCNVDDRLSDHNENIMKIIASVFRHTRKVESAEEKKDKELLDEINPQDENTDENPEGVDETSDETTDESELEGENTNDTEETQDDSLSTDLDNVSVDDANSEVTDSDDADNTPIDESENKDTDENVDDSSTKQSLEEPDGTKNTEEEPVEEPELIDNKSSKDSDDTDDNIKISDTQDDESEEQGEDETDEEYAKRMKKLKEKKSKKE